MSELSEESGLPETGATAAQVEAAARAIHAHQEYSTCWDDEEAGSPSRMGTKMRPLGDHGRTFYRGLARAALGAVIPPGGDFVLWAMPRADARDLLGWLRHNRPLGMPDQTFDGLVDALATECHSPT